MNEKLWDNDQQLLELVRKELFSAVIGDIMDNLGLRNQFLPPQIQPLRSDMVVAGRAMPVLEADAHEPQASPFSDKPFGLMLEALDDLKPHEVYICTGASPDYALWGELMSTRALKLGAVGAVVDGYSRDTNGILNLNFPTFSYGRYAQDQAPRGKVVAFRTEIMLGDVSVKPGDLIFGDLDGVCVVPQDRESEIIAGALEKARGEQQVKLAIESGMSACQAFEQFGIM